MSKVSASEKIGPEEAWRTKGALTVYGAPEGADALAVKAASEIRGGPIIHVARDGARAASFRSLIGFFAPALPIIEFPAWDCLPYDRVSPSPSMLAQRMAALSVIASMPTDAPLLISTTVNAATQRTPPQEIVAQSRFSAAPGATVDIDSLTRFLSENGYLRSSTVREPGEFAVRGGLVDLFPPGAPEPVRLDFFGDQLESVRSFDASTQMTTRQLREIALAGATELILNEDRISRFRSGFVKAFGAADHSPVYDAVSAGQQYQGAEHLLPLFYERMESLFDYAPDALYVFDHLADDAVAERLSAIVDHYEARMEDSRERKGAASEFSAPRYYPLPPDALYLTETDWAERLARIDLRRLSPFQPQEGRRSFTFGGAVGKTFAAERAAVNTNVFDAVRDHVENLKQEGRAPLIACWSDGSADRMRTVLADHGVANPTIFSTWRDAKAGVKSATGVVVAELENGFVTEEFAFISEQDILGDRMVRRRASRRAENFLTEASTLSIGDLIVHVDHGIGRYRGLKTLAIQGAPHDCLQLEYAGGDKLFLPVENIDLLSRFGSDDPDAALDRLGGAGWQNRKSKMRARIRMLAEQLIAIAAKREMKSVDGITRSGGAYDEFCARFAYAETEDQETAIADVVEDLARGRPMDRLVCGDVGFGKTEVALRAAFLVAMSGRQVAVIAPTTLLARQHYKTFSSRFRGLPVNIAPLTRFVSAADAERTRKGVAEGGVDIVIGTHALLAKSVSFRDLGLLIVDEEQHFGVKHKERLKEYRADTHVLTLTATPIPRTLQLAMSGIRDLSLIATPPIDRLAVRTTVGPFDPVVARETLLREHYRGGQSFYVAPRISDLDGIAAFLDESVPEVKYRVAHGQMPGTELESIMNAFYDGQFDVLVSTTIIESGLDIPTANTLIVHRADRFGLSQLYQLRGRVGRSKVRAYAYLTTSPRERMTESAERRLKVMQSLDTLGAGFTLASHDLDIRGAGNLLGEEQSGQVKEVGVELYQHMLEEAVAELREGGAPGADDWSPQINIGTAVLIPDHYVSDLNVRMALYRRLGDIKTDDEIRAFGAELIDRFGPLPNEVEHLLEIVGIKNLCRSAGVAKIDAGPKGAVITFRNGEFANPAGLVQFISTSPHDVKLRPDQSLVFQQDWPGSSARLKGCRRVLQLLNDIAADA